MERARIRIGALVDIVLKAHQSTGQLSRGTVSEILTNSSHHPRGCKVRLEDGRVGRVQAVISSPGSSSNERNELNFNSRGRLPDTVSPPPPTGLTLSDFLPDFGEKEITSGKEWACLICTLENSGRDRVCGACGSDRPEKATLQNSSVTCSRCTFINSKGSVICQACGGAL